jgi:hypothetical protein
MTGDEILANLGHKAPPYHPRCRTALVASFDVTARTIAEAKEIAKNEFGVNADFGGKENLTLANHINKGLYEARDRGMKMPQEIIIDSVLANSMKKYPKNAPAAFLEPVNSPNKKVTILIDNKNTYWKNIKANSYEDHISRWSSTDLEFHVILHELAHCNHFIKNESSYRKIDPHPLSMAKKIKKEVSDYAVYRKREFIAEVEVGLMNNKKYSKEIMDYYAEVMK